MPTSLKQTLLSLPRRILPHRLYGALHRWYVSRLAQHRSMVSRQSMLMRCVQRYLLRRRPTLYHFEIHITDHCNLNCTSCNHYSTLAPEWFANPAQYQRDIAMMAATFGIIEQMKIMGGEPLLHPRIGSFVEITRALLPDTRIYLMTNGLLLTRMAPSFWQTLAEKKVILLCDNYPIKLDRVGIEQRANEYGVTLEWMAPIETFLQVPLEVDATSDATCSFAACETFSNCPIVRDGFLYPCAPIAYNDLLSSYFSLQGLEPTADDRYPLTPHPSPAQSWEAMEFLLTPRQWCAHCNFERSQAVPWSISRRSLDEWVF